MSEKKPLCGTGEKGDEITIENDQAFEGMVVEDEETAVRKASPESAEELPEGDVGRPVEPTKVILDR